MSMLEDLLRNQMDSWIKTLPPLPPGWVYDFIPSEPHYNPETNAWETTMEAKPRQILVYPCFCDPEYATRIDVFFDGAFCRVWKEGEWVDKEDYMEI